jgi:hypothetical protein
MPCIARKADTVICNKAITEGQTLCKTHEKVKENKGPNAFAVEQLKLKHKFEKKQEKDIMDPLRRELQNMGRTDPARQALLDEYITRSREFDRRVSNERLALLRQQREEIDRTGINPDQAQIDRRELNALTDRWGGLRRSILRFPNHDWTIDVEQYRWRVQAFIDDRRFRGEDHERLVAHLEMVVLEFQDLMRDNALLAGRHAALAAQRRAVRVALNPNENMGAFAQDKQNVHTTAAVKQVKHNIEVIRNIFVPEEYRWNTTKISKTFKEIVYECDLSPKGNWQFASYYCDKATIYDMEPGIFGIMVDGVWQFIRDSKDKSCLVKILKTEFEDNIGMCAQGNLSRVCNILSGYLPGIGQAESISEILGREFPKLKELKDEDARIAHAQRILRENNVPEVEWDVWIDALRE